MPKYSLNPFTNRLDRTLTDAEVTALVADTYLKLDCSNDPLTGDLTLNNTLTALTLPGFTTKSILFIGAAGVLSQDNSSLNYTDATDTLYAYILASTALNLSGWTTGSVPFMSATGYLTEDTDFNFITGSNTLNVPNATLTGNVTLDSDTGGLILGADQDCTIYHSGANLMITNSTGDTYLSTAGYQFAFTGCDLVQIRSIDMGTTIADAGIFTMTMGAQIGDPIFTVDMANDATGNTTFTTDTGDMVFVSGGGDVSFSDDNVTTTGTMTAEHIHSTDDLQVDDLGTFEGVGGTAVRANNDIILKSGERLVYDGS
jgi:hypothetical protein